MPQDEDRTLAEDITTPVEIQPGLDRATPDDWSWKKVSASQPNSAIFHISHSESTRVLIDKVGPSDSPADANFVLKEEIPIVILDSLDKYWAAESRTQLPLSGVRVPVEGDTVAEPNGRWPPTWAPNSACCCCYPVLTRARSRPPCWRT